MDNAKPLNDLERFELLQAMYPDWLTDDSDLGDEEELLVEMAIDPETFDELMGRVVMCAMPMSSPLSNTAHHVLGRVSINGDSVNMIAAVKRPVSA